MNGADEKITMPKPRSSASKISATVPLSLYQLSLRDFAHSFQAYPEFVSGAAPATPAKNRNTINVWIF